MDSIGRLFEQCETSEKQEVGKATERGCRQVLVTFAAVLGVLLFLTQGQAAYAATITVNTTDDELNIDGDCSLREAIQAANTDTAVDACTAGSGADTIVLPASTYILSIAGTGEDANASGDLDITVDLTIVGAGAATTIIDGAGLDRLFHIVGGTVEISGLTIQNGHSFDAYGPTFGGGILNHGTLTLNNSTVSGNSARSGAPAGSGVGGGLYNVGLMNLNNSTVTANTATLAGGIGNGGTLTLSSSTVSANTATAYGGGMTNGGMATLNSSTVSGNTSVGSNGGGIINFATLTLNGTTVSGNTSGASSGGISNETGSTATLNNSTVSGNTANNVGGGIGNDWGTTVTLNNSTVSANTATLAGGIGGPATLRNTIVANNTSDDCSVPITSAGHNLDSDGTCGLTGTGDIGSTDPLLGPLQDNGGPTFTHALLPGSPAIDAGSPDCPPPFTDQRGVPRPQGPACDIGAFELDAITGLQNLTDDINGLGLSKAVSRPA